MAETTGSSSGASKLERQRLEKLSAIRELGVDPYGGRYDGVEPAAVVKTRFDDAGRDQEATCAGRIVLLRDIGKLIFITLRDSSGTIQVGLSKKMLGEKWRLAKLLEVGDIIGASGVLGRTKTGEITIWVGGEGLTILSKCLCPPPEKFHGLADIDQRYRQRYVDLWSNPEVMDRNSLDMDLFLRISPELFLKRLLVGGMERVFEVNRNFRNEGLSRQHNPEFTMLELYQAYADYNVMMELAEQMIGLCVEKFCPGGRVQFGDLTIDYSRPWRRASYAELLGQYAGCDIDDIQGVRAKARQLGLEEAEMDDVVVVNEVFEATVEENLVCPTFVIDYPAELCPLTRRKRDAPEYAERFELYIARMELANAYTELNDPAVQEENFKIQLRGQQESMAKMDRDFITALKYGMPPAGGLGIGIDRLVMVLTGSRSIRDVVLFPLLKPKGGGAAD